MNIRMIYLFLRILFILLCLSSINQFCLGKKKIENFKETIYVWIV